MGRFYKLILIPAIFVSIVSGCAPAEGNSQAAQPDYESTKKMMVDMLQTEEGKKAISEAITDEEVQQNLIMEQAFVKETIQSTLTSEEARAFWEDTMQDPEFAQALAESLKKETEEMLKSLMKDPEYQAMMMDILKDPEMEKAALDLMKTREYRQQVMTVMAEAFESPFFVAKVNQILGKVTAEQLQQEAEKQEEQAQEEEDEGGEEGS
ncbi:spore germination lipoprotein GerD [Alkalihalobacterium chitinilyticum]|uniref:Spore germination lipoprotein GerD n=1 Tax=Alkalihalobacterium chitinilyticum TaxID=2980103 RepID=A0ABT5VKQ3_9BACI|nr:spore germination lipoprotein GerD [Alkalihalobacterium chitinilyticum]MDE5415801.1 spore germination lipoprotein GerD [Alkalihalobacterium chitinilyticum]